MSSNAAAPAESLKQFQIPFFRPTIGEAEINSVVETLRSGWLTTGPKTKRFEQEFAKSVGAEFAIAVNSCTAALHLALEAVGVGRDDEVIVPTLTFASTGEVVMHLGAKPVLVDVCADTLCIDPDQIERLITPKTKAIMPVHYGGHPADMDEIHAIARKHGIHVIEDAAHAIPTEYGGRRVGTISDLTCFSFYANKTMTTGEGGMVTTNDQELADRVRLMSLHGISKDAWKRFSAEGSWYYEILAPGYKYNMTDINAALGLNQLERSGEFHQRRSAIVQAYDAGLADVEEIKLPAVRPDVVHAWHLYVIQVDIERLSINRNDFIKALNGAGIGTSVHYLPLHMHPLYRDRFGYQPSDLPVAQSAFDRIISLPVYPTMTESEVDYVISTVRSIVEENRGR
ncbi:MAG TPA: DegT/DnrJ/EryC1/StrS family aminotransferase [Caulifigura sp.]|jgi:perosamine synthetase|nr:DegT/DnrJ/EryC1/StrS family aminotransferase [Caulifigura sp.]